MAGIDMDMYYELAVEDQMAVQTNFEKEAEQMIKLQEEAYKITNADG